jgi:phosphoribosylformimino-5-aminoimidazole carboxamide ribotide isomerase
MGRDRGGAGDAHKLVSPGRPSSPMSAPTGFELIPAIDLLEGRCVRLSQGRYDAATVYSEDPGAVAARFAAHPIRRLHVVDLDGARTGRPGNREAIRAILGAVPGVSVQLGGGLRSLAAVEDAFGLGVDRVVIGTVAVREPALLRDCARRYPGRVVVGIDAREGRVSVEGWTEMSELSALELARKFEDAGVVAIVYTDIARDGMLAGPNLEATASLAEGVGLPVFASGGVSSMDDLRRAAELKKRGVAGIIVGRALYTGALELGRALEIIACC